MYLNKAIIIGNLTRDPETKSSHYEKVEKVIKKHHEYRIPQIVALKVEQGYKPYLDWIDSNVK
jgi:periplasmic divalent cation tolerance protein